MSCLYSKDTSPQNWETSSDSQTTDEDHDTPKVSGDFEEELIETEDLNTKVLNLCSKKFNSLLFLAPPEIRTEQESDNREEMVEAAIDNDITKNILTSLGEELILKPSQKTDDKVKDTPIDQSKKSYGIPDGGWVCLMCRNYNFRGRTKCNRCGKPKTKHDPEGKPQHLMRREGEEELSINKPKQLKERLGDWLCLSCHNINFCFRQQCNRCKREKTLAGVPLSEEYVWVRSFHRRVKHFPMQCDGNGYPLVFQQLSMVSTAA